MAKQRVSENTQTASAAELEAELTTLRQEIWDNRQKIRSGALRQVHLIRKSRRKIARTKTLLRELQLSSNA